MRMKKLFVLAVIVGGLTIIDLNPTSLWRGNTCYAVNPARNDGSYLATSQSVSIYTQEGHSKGSFTVYLHQGKKYIKFQNTWICIQGKSRFGYKGNWYVIK